MEDSFRSLARAFCHFLGGTLFSRITGLTRDIATAYAFGTSASVAALLVAFRLSHCLRRLLGEGALQGAFTPYYEELRQSSPAHAARFFYDLRAALILTLTLCIGIGMATLTLLSAEDIWSENAREVAFLTTILLPGLLFICLYGLHSAFLQCQGDFLIAAAAPALLNIGWIFGVIALAHLPAEQAMPWLAGAIVIATFAQWIATLPASHRTLAPYRQSFWQCHPYSLEIRRLLRPLLYSMSGVAASQVNSALDALFARYADASGPAYLWYAIRLQQLPLAIFGIAIAGVLLPPLSRAAKSGNDAQFRKLFRYTLVAALLFLSVATLALILGGPYLIHAIYDHGDFDAISATMTESCLLGYTSALLPSGLVICLVPVFYARGDYRLPMYASLISIIANMALNFFCVGVFGLGCASIAWTTGISSWINLAILLPCIRLSSRTGERTIGLYATP